MTAAYQLPLFAQFPLSELFRMRKARLRETLLTVSLPINQRDLVDTLCMNLELYPIELRTEDLHIEVEPAGKMGELASRFIAIRSLFRSWATPSFGCSARTRNMIGPMANIFVSA